MSSLSNTQTNTRSMNGLVDIQANSGTFDEIDCNTLNVNLSATAPTIANPLDYSNNIATTEWVTNHAGVGYVTINTSQTLTTGIKTFTNLPQSSAVPTLGNELVNKTFTDATYVDFVNNETIGGVKTFTSLPQSSAVPTLGNELVNKTFTDATYVDFVNNETIGGIKSFTSLPQSSAVPTLGNELVNKTFVDGAISTAGGSYVTLAGVPQFITGDKTFNGYVDFLSLEASIITNTGGIFTPNMGSIIATDPISIVPSQSSGTCNIATFATRTGAINIGTGSSAKTMTIGGTATTTNINSLTTTINTSTTSGNGITHSSTTTTGDDMRLTATGGYIARLGEGSATAGLTLLGVDSGTSIIKATTSALEIRADAGLTFTGTIGSNNTFSGTNTLTGTTTFQNNVTVQAGNTVRYGSRSVGSPSGVDLGQTNVNEITLQLVTTSDDFIFRTSGGSNMMTFGNGGMTATFPFAMSHNFLINQSTYPSTSTTQLGYTIQKTFATTVLGDTTGTFTVVGTGQALGTNKGVYLITCGFELTNSGSDTVNNKALCLSLSSGSGTPVNSYGAWEYYEEINDSMGSAGTRFIGTLTGVYTKTTTSAETLYLNGYANTSGSQTISARGDCSITRIG